MRVRIVDGAAELVLENPPLRETLVVAEVLDTLKGPAPAGPLRFAQHGHGVPMYRAGEEVVVFAQAIGRSRELGKSALADHVAWVSTQEAELRFPVDDATRAPFVAAVRAYAGLEALPPDARLAALRTLTVELLASSSDERLARSALRDLTLAPDAPLVAKADVPVLEGVLANPARSIGLRIGLLAELERRGLVDGPARWAGLLDGTHGADRIAVARAAGAHPSAPVTKALVALLSSDDPLLVSTAAISLGAPGNEPAVAPLAKLLASEEPRVRMAAIRGLGGVGSPRAREVLAEAAREHPEPATRRRAAAELKR